MTDTSSSRPTLLKSASELGPVVRERRKSQSLRMTGEIADGWLPTHVSLDHLPGMLADLAAGAAQVVPVVTAVAPEDVPPAARYFA